MAYNSIYTRINWKNETESRSTPLGATNLNKMDYALSEIDKRVVNLDSVKAEKSTVLNLVSDWQMNEETGIITVTKVNGEKIVFDLNVEKIPVSFEMSEDGILSMTTEDGSVFTANIGDMIPIMTFNSSDSINVTVSEDENGKTYTFEVKDGSITEEKLNPNYLAILKVASETAKENADIAIENANSAIDSAESAKQYRNEAEQFRNEAESIVGVEVSQITSDIALNRQTLGYTKKNLIKTSLNIMKEQNTVGAWNGNVYTANGGTFTVNEDLSVTINGTFTADTQCSLNKQLDYAINKYTFSAGVEMPANVYLTAYTKSNGGVSIPSGYQQLTYDYPSNITQVYIYVKSGVAVNNLTLYPMLRLASITDSSYEPYVEDVDTRLKSLESGSGGGGTGTTDYEDLYNKPSINDVELSGNITLEEIGAQAEGNYAELDEYGNLNVPQWVNALGLETSDGIRDSGGIDEDNYYGGNAVVKTEDELSSLTAEGYMPDALLVKELHQRMGGYSFYNNPYVVYEKSSSEPFLLNGEYILSDSDTGSIYITDTENYYSAIASGDYKRREGADTVSPFNLAKESIVVNKTDGTTATYTITKNCLLIVQSFEQNETSAFNSTIPTVDENITLIELSKNVVGRGDYHSGVAVYQALVNGSGNVSLTKNRTALYIIL